MYYLSGMLRTHRFRTISFRLLRLTVLLVVPAFCILTFEGVCKAQEAERISAFVSNIEVRADGSLVVKETILTHSVGEQIRHGIYRAFVARNGRPALRLTLLDARLDGNRIENRTETTDRQVRVYLGRPDSRLAPGDHVFEISYHTERVVDLTGSRARLYWNVTGDEWSFPIDSVESVISFPPGTVPDETVVSAYTGAYGSIEGRYWYKWTKDESVSQSKRLRLWTDSLQPQEGLTVHVTWPANSLSYRWKIAALFINDRFVGYGALGLAVLLLYWAVSWFFYGRDPEQGTITDRSTPPEQISAAGIRYLLQMFPDNKTFTTAVVSLGSKGFLQVIAEDDDYTVVRKRSDLHGLPLEERELAKVLFGSKERVSLRMDSRRIRKSLEAFRKGLEKNYRKYFVINRRFILPAALISAVGLGSTLWVALEGKSRVQAVLTLVGVLILLLLFRMLHRLWPDSIQELRRRRAASLSPEGPLDEGDGILPTVIVFIAVVLFAGVIATITGTAWIMLLLIYLCGEPVIHQSDQSAHHRGPATAGRDRRLPQISSTVRCVPKRSGRPSSSVITV
jgi:hypothetical protein